MRPLLLAALAAAACSASFSGNGDSGPLPWEVRETGWRTDPAWYDRQAEKCVYDATRSIYGVERRYAAIAYTNKQWMDPRTTTKSATDGGVEVFKHHWSERVPTENYDYDFSTATFVRTSDLAPFKLTAATQDDCGSSFKQVWRDGDELAWLSSVYFPGAGVAEGKLERERVHFLDALTLALRDFPFAEAAESEDELIYSFQVVPGQKEVRATPFEPIEAGAVYAGTETLDLPVGRVEAHRVTLMTFPESGRTDHVFWFATDGSAPWLHALVRYEGPRGRTYRLRSIERTAYWER